MTQYDSQLRDLILAHVPADGERIGNIKLQKDLTNVADFDFDELDYKRVRDALVAEGLLGKGQGKGGRVSHRDSSAALVLGYQWLGSAKGWE